MYIQACYSLHMAASAKTTQINLRLSAQDLEDIDECARENGYAPGQRSQFMRHAAKSFGRELDEWTVDKIDTARTQLDAAAITLSEIYEEDEDEDEDEDEEYVPLWRR